MSGSLDSTSAELSSIAEKLAQYRVRLAALADPFVGTDRDDLVVTIHEAERQLRAAERGVRRAERATR